LITGAALGVTGLVLYLTSPSPGPPEKEAAPTALHLGPGSATLEIAF
jgi:hypothetical protein